jgi:hypothetical protein
MACNNGKGMTTVHLMTGIRKQWIGPGHVITGGVIIFGLFVLLLLAVPAIQAQTSTEDHPVTTAPPRLFRDTLYVLDSAYLEVNLDNQEIYRHTRSGHVDTLLCSTGNPDLPKGIATRPGIFTVKWKADVHISSHFNVPMYFWMPFDKGIGFHALEKRDYYSFLGYQPSSHGCVRVSYESGEDLFKYTPVGTLVLVHHGDPARTLEFAETTFKELRVMKRIDTGLLKRRLDAVKKGRSNDRSLKEKLAIPVGISFNSAIDVE